jgi:hypothetical protein
MSTGLSNGISLVRSPKRRAIEREDFLQPLLQGALFPISKRNLAVVVRFPDVTDEEFRLVLDFARPRLVVDLRSVPTFAIGRLNRRFVFDSLKKAEALYLEVDVSADGGEWPGIAQKSTALVIEAWQNQNGPLVFLTHRDDGPGDGLPSVIRKLAEHASVQWDLFEVPQFR